VGGALLNCGAAVLRPYETLTTPLRFANLLFFAHDYWFV
jgi:hypothetical protein